MVHKYAIQNIWAHHINNNHLKICVLPDEVNSIVECFFNGGHIEQKIGF